MQSTDTGRISIAGIVVLLTLAEFMSYAVFRASSEEERPPGTPVQE